MVKAWCLKHPPQKRWDLFQRPLFANTEPTIDCVVVHLDADIVRTIVAREGWARAKPQNSSEEGALLREVIEHWLWPDSNRIGEDRHVLFLAVQSTESWIVAGALADLRLPEAVDPVPLLLRINPGLANARAPGKLSKTKKRWQKLWRRHLNGKVSAVAARCPHLLVALTQLETVASVVER